MSTLRKLLREELALNAHEDNEAHLRCTCDDCMADFEAIALRAGLDDGRALASDTAAREADVAGVIALLQLRYSAWLNSDDSNPHRPIYSLAVDSARREILWRFAEQARGAPQGGTGK